MLTLVIGGAASGKSAYAESLCLRAPLPRTYLATMQVWDAECAARVAKHRAMRAEKQFTTVECPLHLDRLTLPRRGIVLLEDLGNPQDQLPPVIHIAGTNGKGSTSAMLSSRITCSCRASRNFFSRRMVSSTWALPRRPMMPMLRNGSMELSTTDE